MSSRRKSKLRSYSKRVTIKDIAEKANVSIGTVDRALNNRGRISIETKEKILQIAKELNYQKNEFARALRIRNDVKILAIYPMQPERYMIHFTKGFKEASNELSNFGLVLDTIRTNTLDPQDILRIIDTIDIHNYDGILLNAGGPELNEFIDYAVSENIAVATFNSDSPTSKRLFFSGENHFTAGRLCGELTAKLLKGHGTVSLFTGISTVYALQKRIEGFVDTITKEYPDISIINNISHDDNLDIRHQRAEQLLFENPMADAIFCNSATGALPICQALEANKIKNGPIVIGYDEDEDLEQMLMKNICTALIFQDPKRQAEEALHYLFRHLYSGDPVPTKKESLIIPTIILRGNIELMSN